MKNKIRYPCPFCGAECEKRESRVAKMMVGKPIAMYKCNNQSCGAIISFDNRDCNLNPNITDRWFFRRYLGGDSNEKS